MTYTADDFKRAKIARHPSPATAFRHSDRSAWTTSDTTGYYTDKWMAEHGWVPVQERGGDDCECPAHKVPWMTVAKNWQARAEKAEKERDDARYGMEVATQQRNNWEAMARQAMAEQSRPLTPDDITDEVHSRAVIEARKHKGTKDALHAEIQMILKAALTEPPSRPDGAEEIQAALIGATNSEGLELDALDASKDAYRALSDALASRGVRVTTSKEQS